MSSMDIDEMVVSASSTEDERTIVFLQPQLPFHLDCRRLVVLSVMSQDSGDRDLVSTWIT